MGKARVRRSVLSVQEMRDVLGRFTPPVLTRMDRIKRHHPAPDGLPGGGEMSPLGSGGGSSSTELAALAGLVGDREDDDRPDLFDDAGDLIRRLPADPVGEALDEAFESLRQARDLIVRAHKLTEGVFNAADVKVGRQPNSGYCEGCNRVVSGTPDDRMVKGLCRDCIGDYYRVFPDKDQRPSIPDWLQSQPAVLLRRREGRRPGRLRSVG